jgi:hypothetical protein
VARESGKSMGNKMGIFNELGKHNPAGHDYNGFIYDSGNLFAIWANDYYGDDAGALYFTRTSYTSVEEMVKVEDLKDYRIYTVDGKLVKGNLNELPRGIGSKGRKVKQTAL